MTVDVIIPAKNERIATLIPTIMAFMPNELVQSILIVDNGLSVETMEAISILTLIREGDLSGIVDMIHRPEAKGKGQAVMEGLRFLGRPGDVLDRIVFCDADLYGFHRNHADALCNWDGPGMLIGVPDYVPFSHVPWPVERPNWVGNSGERNVPFSLVRDLNLHGYAMETQINAAAKRANIGVTDIPLPGVQGTDRWSPVRHAAMISDAEWLKENGV